MDNPVVEIGLNKMNQICFNNLSSQPLCSNEAEIEQRMSLYIQVLQMVGINGIKKVRYAVDLTTVLLREDYSVQDYCNSHMKIDTARLLLSMATKPQVPEEDDKMLEQYLETETYVIKDQPIKADGFNAAFCMGTYCIGFASDVFWSMSRFGIIVSSNGETENHIWYCLSTPAHFQDAKFQDWLDQFLPLDLQVSSLNPDDKIINLRNDHGKDKLLEHAKSLMNNHYVEGVLTSLAFNNHAKFYVSKQSDFAHGLIDVVLFWESQGYSMRVKTTGRNIRETMAIAELLTEKYGKRPRLKN